MWFFKSSVTHRFVELFPALRKRCFGILLKLVWNLTKPQIRWSEYILFLLRVSLSQAQVVEKLVSAFHGINHYTVDKWLGKQLWYLLDRDVSSRKCYTPFEQLGRGGFSWCRCHADAANYHCHSWWKMMLENCFSNSLIIDKENSKEINV